MARQEPAKRSDVNRVTGTLETKHITSINRDVIKSYLIEKVVPSIKEKWPRDGSSQSIFIQQNNARTYINCDDEEFHRVATEDEFDIRLMYQPLNSLDLNILDLVFFSSIQSLQHTEVSKSIDKLINVVVKAYEIFLKIISNYVFLTLQSCTIEIMRTRGSHNYKTSHSKISLRKRKSTSYSTEM